MTEEPSRCAEPACEPLRCPGDRGWSRRDTSILVAVSAALAAIVFSRQLLLGKTFALRDFIMYTWPARQALAEALAAGRVPEWNDFVGFGMPFAAMPTNGVGYPPLWILAALPLPAGIHAVMAFHLFAAGLGTGLLARRLGAGVLGASLAAGALMTSGYVTSMIVVGTYLSIAWVPWVAWAADRVAALDGEDSAPKAALRTVAVLAMVLSGQVLSGDPASAITAGLLAVVLTLARSRNRIRAMVRLGIAVVGAVLMSSAVVLPAAAIVGWSTRASGVDHFQWSLHPWRLVELIWPDVLGNPVDAYADLARVVADMGRGHVEARWASSVYLGGPLLALAVFATLARRDLLGVFLGSLFFVVLALGAFSPVYVAYRTVFPLERLLQFPEKHMLGAVVLWCALTGAGLERLRTRLDMLRTRFVVAACLPTGLAVAAFFGLKSIYLDRLARAAAAVHLPTPDVQRALAHIFAHGVAAFLVAAVAAVLLAERRTWLAAAGGAIVIAHATAIGWQLTPLVDTGAMQAVPALLAHVPGRSAGGVRPRVLRWDLVEESFWLAKPTPQQFATYTHDTLGINVAGRYGFEPFPGYEGFRSQQFAYFLASALNSSGMSMDSFASKHAIDYIVAPAIDAARLRLPVVGESSQGWRLVVVPSQRTRAFVASRWDWVSPSRAVATSIWRGRFYDPGSIALTGSPTADVSTAPETEPPRPCYVRSTTPEDVSLYCASSFGGYAVLADEDVPGWSATVDGTPAAISKAEVLFRAVRVGPGAHEVRFTYRTPFLRTGIAVSIVSWLAAAALVAWTKRSRRWSTPVVPT